MTTTSAITHVWHLTRALLGTNTEDAWERFRVIKRTAQFTFVQRVPECEETVWPYFRESDPVRLKTVDLLSKACAWSAKTRSLYHLGPRLDASIVWRKTAMGYSADTKATDQRHRQQSGKRESDRSYLIDQIACIKRDVTDMRQGLLAKRDLRWWLDNRINEWSRLRAKLREVEVRK